MIYYTYIHYNAITNEPFYVGKGKDNRAWKSTSRSKYWSRVVKKYGYIVKIVEENLSEEEAYKKEKELIKLYGRRDLKTGILINMTDGGDGYTGGIITEELREKHRKNSTGRKHTEESKKKMSEAQKGRLPSKEAIEKSRLSRIGLKQTEESNKKRSDTLIGRLFDKDSRYKLSEKAKKVRTESEKKKMSESKLGKTPTSRNQLVKCKETGEIFVGIKSAQNWLNNITQVLSKGQVSRVCRGKIKTTCGYSFEFVSMEDKPNV